MVALFHVLKAFGLTTFVGKPHPLCKAKSIRHAVFLVQEKKAAKSLGGIWLLPKIKQRMASTSQYESMPYQDLSLCC